ncbi:protein translocase, SecG subunit [Synechococcus sp. PCC 7502]|nr:preprotein translocase subunit SecG [Synechococcus sp. PCC 7502]AFY72745.1 protein translocase, SecG subunit [Synechococcus sp. PCC 7502]
MYIALKVAWAVIAASLIFLILLHSPKGDGLGGIGGQAQLFASTKSAETSLNRLTWILTVLFLGLTIVLSAGWIPNNVSKPTPSALVSPIDQPQSSIPLNLEAQTESIPQPGT